MREMKDSGVEWIGEIPSDWQLTQTRRLFHNEKRIVGDAVDQYERLALTLNGVIRRSKDDSEGLQPEKFEGYQILKENELVFKMIDLENVNTSRVGISPYTGLVSPAYIVLTNNSSDNRYAYYWFMFMYYFEIFNHLGGDGVRSALNVKDMLSMPIPNISQENRKRISDYLDSKCSQIDAIIEKQQASICKLIEYKKSIIYEMIKENEDNNKVRLKNIIVNVQSGLSAVSSEDNGVESGNYVLRTSAVSSGEYKRDEIKPVMTNCINRLICPLEDDILVVSRMNTSKMVGFAAYIEKADTNYYLPDKLWKVIADRKKVCTKYLWYAINSPVIHDQYASIATGTSDSMINISISDFTGAKFSLPPLEKQKEIVKTLDEKVSYIEQQVELKSQIIDKLIRYKKSLIYEVVTGKKEV